jgi:hypothetical protein
MGAGTARTAALVSAGQDQSPTVCLRNHPQYGYRARSIRKSGNLRTIKLRHLTARENAVTALSIFAHPHTTEIIEQPPSAEETD